MRDSSIIMGCNYSGLFNESLASRWGVVDLDWSNDKSSWLESRPIDDEAEMLQTSRRIVAQSGGRTKMWVYRNLVWAPSWFRDIRELLEDPAYAGFFVRYKPNGPYKNNNCTGRLCSGAFHATFQTMLPANTTAPARARTQAGVCDEEGCDCGGVVPCAWYLFDHRNASAREWIVQKHLLSPAGLLDGAIAGYFLDDTWDPKRGPANEGPGAQNWMADTGLSTSDGAALAAGWRQTMDAANAAVVAHGGYTWQMLYNNSTTAQAPFNGKQECAAYLRQACVRPSPLAKQALMYGFSVDRTTHHNIVDLQEHLAAFLLIRHEALTIIVKVAQYPKRQQCFLADACQGDGTSSCVSKTLP